MSRNTTLNLRRLHNIRRHFHTNVAAFVQKMAQDTEAYVKDNFSPRSPSVAYAPPGIDTGTLKNSIIARPGENPFIWFLIVGAHYGLPLEFGTMHMAPRPFILPGVRHTANNIPRGAMVKVVLG